MIKIDGKSLALQKQKHLSKEISSFPSSPQLTVILVGDNLASKIYVENKLKACRQVGIQSSLIKLDSQISKAQLIDEIHKINKNPQIHGLLLQLPLPSYLESHEILTHLASSKDVDGLTLENQARLWLNQPGIKPCTPYGILKLLTHYDIPIRTKKAVVLGRSPIVGKPMAALLLNQGATVTICHSQTKNLKQETLSADIVVVAVGKKKFIDKTYFKPEATVIDVGIHSLGMENSKRKLCGDVDCESLDVKAFTPVPGGVGPMTIYQLLENTVELYKKNG